MDDGTQHYLKYKYAKSHYDGNLDNYNFDEEVTLVEPILIPQTFYIDKDEQLNKQGEKCSMCQGTGNGYNLPGSFREGIIGFVICPACNGTGFRNPDYKHPLDDILDKF